MGHTSPACLEVRAIIHMPKVAPASRTEDPCVHTNALTSELERGIRRAILFGCTSNHQQHKEVHRYMHNLIG